MTPEEILSQYLESRNEDSSFNGCIKAKTQAIEAIKQYAKQMCDKQKKNCISELHQNSKHFSGQDVITITTTNYPKELQD